jgi:hypothetical protein
MGHEGAIDLDHVDRQSAQARQRRVAGSEVVERKPEAGGAKLLEGRQRALGLERPPDLRQLEHDAPRV